MKLPLYLIQEHAADKAGLHWDLRLQAIDNTGKQVLYSWAFPKGVPKKEGIKRLALRMPDHEMSWASFEGIIPKGEYGAGKVSIYDKGFYKPIKISRGKMLFEIMGKKIKGVYCLTVMRGDDSKWFLEKQQIIDQQED